jgi:streptopain
MNIFKFKIAKTKYYNYWKLILLILFLFKITSCEKQEFIPDNVISVEAVKIDLAKNIAEKIIFPDESDLKFWEGNKEIKEIETIEDNGVPCFYIINYKQEKGFLILSADKRCMPILAFSHEGSINTENITGGLADWVEESKFYVKSMKADTSKEIAYNKVLWEEIAGKTAPPVDDDPIIDPENPPDIEPTTTVKGPLLTSKWGQGDGFNDYCPVIWGGPGGNAAAGCTTIALAQIMNYHEYPLSYSWNLMPDIAYTDEMALFIRDVGDAIDVDWGAYDTGLTPEEQKVNIPSALENTFNYNSSGYYIEYYGNHQIVIDEINHNRPVYMRGGAEEFLGGIISYYGGGHAWVCDGYIKIAYLTHSTLYLSMNWGWEGVSNGWFAFNNFNPVLSGEIKDYNFETGCIIGIHP